MPASKLLGAWGEAVAAEYLRKHHYRVIAQGYSSRYGEIDLIAVKGKFLVFVEVKLRKSARFAQGREFVTRTKQAKIVAAAQSWLQVHPTSLQPRFDVMEIYAPAGADVSKLEMNYIENAFELI